MNRTARRLVGQVVVVGYLMAVTGTSLLHEHGSRAMGMSRADSSIPHRSPTRDQTPLSDDHCLACQFYSAQPHLAPAVQIVCPDELVSAIRLPSVGCPTDEVRGDLLPRGPPVAV